MLGLSSYLKTVNGGDDQIRLPWGRGALSPGVSLVWSWATWALSIIFFSSILSFWNPYSPVAVSSATRPQEHLAPVNPLPLERRSSCAQGGVEKDEYNTPLHVGALFIILFVSTLACAFPILAVKFPGLRIPGRFFFAVRHFGTGVLIATAFVHLLPTAFISLMDPCLGSFWNEDYPAISGAIALAAIFFVTVIEMVFHPSRRNTRPVDFTSSHEDCQADEAPKNLDGHGCMGNVGMLPIRDMGPLRGRSSSVGRGLSTVNSHVERPGDVVVQNESPDADQEGQQHRGQSLDRSPETSQPPSALTPEQQQRKEILQCVLLELGILFHSVFIGMALSVSIGNEFIILLIAIVFHRKCNPAATFLHGSYKLTIHVAETFEGLALGSRIAAIKWPSGKRQPWSMALAYGCT